MMGRALHVKSNMGSPPAETANLAILGGSISSQLISVDLAAIQIAMRALIMGIASAVTADTA